MDYLIKGVGLGNDPNSPAVHDAANSLSKPLPNIELQSENDPEMGDQPHATQ